VVVPRDVIGLHGSPATPPDLDEGDSVARTEVVGIVVAAGSGERLGHDLPKAFVEVGGRPLAVWAIEGLRAGGIEHLVVVVPAAWVQRAQESLAAPAGSSQHPDDDGGTDASNDRPTIEVVAGGATRTASVAAGLALVSDDVDVVAVHDAARAFVPPGVVREAVDRVVASLAGDAEVVAAAPGLPVADTLKRVSRDNTVEATLDRSGMIGVQTPQVFPRAVLVRAHEVAATRGATATDDLGLVEELLETGALSGRVAVTPGSALAFKVTMPADLVLAEAVVAGGAVDRHLDEQDS